MLEKIKTSSDYVLKKLETQKEPEYYALNVKNGDCYEINEVAYDILLMIEDGLSKKGIFLKLQNKYKNLKNEDLDKDYESLISMGIDSEILTYG